MWRPCVRTSTGHLFRIDSCFINLHTLWFSLPTHITKGVQYSDEKVEVLGRFDEKSNAHVETDDEEGDLKLKVAFCLAFYCRI